MTKKIPFKNFLTEIKNLILRFPLSSFFLLAMTIRELYTDKNLLTGNYLNSILIFGVLISSISQMIYERFYLKNCKKRRLLYLGSLILLGLYAFYTKSSLSIIDGEIYQFYSIPGIREMILSFTLVIAFIWIPTIKQKEIKFSDSFIVSFRALFTSQFFSLILLIGVSSIILLIESLLFSVGPNWLSNMLTIIFNLIGPLIFLSLIPRYYLIQSDSPKKVKTLRSLIDPSKFLSQLVSYILIPLMVAFSGILILYILRNFGSGFFTESAIESLLLNYIVYGWILLLLSDSVQSELVQIFKKFFPYALIFVVFLQMIATFNQIQIFGITHGRYFILSLGLASLLGALWYLIRKEDLRILPVLAILTGLISLVPPIDAMSVSVRNQLGRIENVLEEENINPEDSNVRAGDSFSTGQKQKIKDSLNYLEDIQALNKLSWLPEEYYPNPIDYFDLDESSDSAINDLWGDDEDKPDDNQEEKKKKIKVIFI